MHIAQFSRRYTLVHVLVLILTVSYVLHLSAFTLYLQTDWCSIH